MSVSFKYRDGYLTSVLCGDIDHHHALSIRESIDSQMSKYMPSKLILDFHDVTFMDSSGVGLVMGRYKNASVFGCGVKLVNMSQKVRRIMKMSGLEKIVEFEKEGE
ncbi:MAG: anti-sigma factor antagonist [Oscillospiraceae bacterium]|nr:anti-sigma factor antagonist [Oscillospiraceae bacterium]MDD7354997.1 anti-sigma factor antagonist [Oscillospiraceae bacterium]MDY3938591.1 anti-sigma factor antagonist [Oscillospiraceae bacterium]